MCGDGNISYIISCQSLCIDIPSIFASDINYKHYLSPLYSYKNRLIELKCLTLSGMTSEIPLYCHMDQIYVQYHPGMTEIIPPIVSTLQMKSLHHLLTLNTNEIESDTYIHTPTASSLTSTSELYGKSMESTKFNIQIEYNSLHCDVPYYMEFAKCSNFKTSDLSLFHFDMAKGELIFNVTNTDFTWIIKATNTKFYCEKCNFLNCDTYQLHGFDEFNESKVPILDITGSDIYGEWDALLQLKLLSCIMPVVATAINVKHDLYRLNIAPYARYESKQNINEMEKNMLQNLRYAFSSLDPKPQCFIGNFDAIKQYFNWYHIQRKPWLQDRFTWVSLHAENINLILNLCTEFKLNAVVGEFRSEFMPKEICISNTKVYLLDPEIDTSASINNDEDCLKVLMMDCEQLTFTRTVLHPQNYDDEHEIMTDVLDINICLENKTTIILPYSLSQNHKPIEWMNILQHKVFVQMCSLFEVYSSMIGLNELSLKRLGPGYECTLNIPSNGINFECDELIIKILDEYLESFLSQLK
eukprot:484347_1